MDNRAIPVHSSEGNNDQSPYNPIAGVQVDFDWKIKLKRAN